MTTINISLPTKMYQDAKIALITRGYASISEFVRNALREKLYPDVTENGFTPKFEEDVLRVEKDANEGGVVQWNGNGSFTDFVSKHPPKQHGPRRIHRSVSPKLEKVT